MVLHKSFALLQNPSRQFNCVVNAAVQLLWVIEFARDVLPTTKIGEVVPMPFIASSVQKAVASNIVGLANSGTVDKCWINSGVQLFVRCTPARLKQVIHTVDTKMLKDNMVRDFVLLMRQLRCGGGGMEYLDKLRTALAALSVAPVA